MSKLVENERRATPPVMREISAPPEVGLPAEIFAGAIAPIHLHERIESMDVLRGVAILGILLLNIYSFGLPFAAISDPTVYGGGGAANLTVWLLTRVLVEGKFRAIFSMLFGASIIVFTSRAEKRAADVGDLYSRRNLYLMLMGVVHAYLIWFGDILFYLGIVALLVFPFRRLRARTLLLIGVAMLAIHTLQNLRGGEHFAHLALRSPARELTLTEYKPDSSALAAEIAAHRGGLMSNIKLNAHIASDAQSSMLYRFFIWDIGGTVVLGMAMMKLRIFDASRSLRFYIVMALVGYGVGVPIDAALAIHWMHRAFDLTLFLERIRIPADLLRICTACGHIAIVMIICKLALLRRTRTALSRVGRMALSNYLLTSVICALIFNGYGLGMFGHLQRYQLLLLAAAVAIALLLFSTLWPRFNRFGPAEWVWRSLTYVKRQPMRALSSG